MRVRVTLRALWALYDLRHLFNPFLDARFSWQLTSHKLLRYLAFVPQIAAFLSNAVLAMTHAGYRALFVGQVLFYMMAGVGYLISGRNVSLAAATVPYYFSLLNLACLHAFGKFIRGQKQVLWQPRTG